MNAAHVEHRGPPATIRVAGCVMCENPTPGNRVFRIHASNDTEFCYRLCVTCLMQFADVNKDAIKTLHEALLTKLWLIREAMPRYGSPARGVSH